MGNIEFEELNVQVESSHRNMTISITGDRAPSFIHVIGPDRPNDVKFYREAIDTVGEVAGGAGIVLGEAGWATEPWTEGGTSFSIRRPDGPGAIDEDT